MSAKGAVACSVDGEPALKIACLCLLCCLLSLPAVADLTGRVTAVARGDTLTVLHGEREPLKIRLLGIAAPEAYQDFGKPSRSRLAALALGRDVLVTGERKDDQGHTLAQVWVAELSCRQPECPKTVDTGLAQLAAGLARHDERNGRELVAGDRQRYTEAEFLAKIRRLGLWAGKNPNISSIWQQNRLVE